MTPKQEVIELTKKLVEFKSVKDNPEELKRIVDFVADYLKGCGEIKKIELNGKPSLVATYTKTTNPDILLTGHLDVVEAEADLFTPQIKGEKMFGRGAADMKGGAAIAILLFKEFAKLGEKERPSLGLMLTTDEEIGGQDGIGKLVGDAGKYGCKFAIALEPNHPKEQGQLNITTKHKGTLWLKLTAKGKAAHASRPWLGENAIENLLQIYQEIKKKFAKVEPEMWKPTVNIGKIEGGNSPNKIPDYAEALIDIRFPEDFDKDKFMQEVAKICGSKVEVEVIEYGNMLFNKEDANIELLQGCVEKQTGKKCLLMQEHGASDMRYFSARGITAVLFGPNGAEYHGKGEFLDLESIEPTYHALKEFILKFK